MKEERKLGRGLSALLGESKSKKETISFNNENASLIESIDLTKIVAGVYQPRKHFDEQEINELADSIREHGVIQPIILRKSDTDESYEIIAGERRFRASKIAGLKKIPAIVKKINNHEALEFAIIENVQRSDLSLIEEAQGYKQLLEEFSYTQEEIAKKLGKSRSHVTNILRLLTLPQIVRELLNQKLISMGHARAIINSNNPERLAQKIVDYSLTVRHVEEIVRIEKGEKEEKISKNKNILKPVSISISSSVIAHPYLSKIENYKPGKSKADSKKVVKLSSNENALGASKAAVEAYRDYKEIFRYPDGSCAGLRNALGKKFNIDEDKIVCGAGSDELIFLLATAFVKAGDEIIYSEHGFLMYPITAQRLGATPVKVKEKNLKTDVDAILKSITSKTKVIFVANPNNPTGSYLTADEVEKLIRQTPKNILIILDHAYEEFVGAQDYPNAIELVNKHQNVVMTRTFSKVYGLASLRIGWSYSSKYIAEILNKIRGPFNVSMPAQAAAIAALEDKEFLTASKNHNQKWLRILFSEFLKFAPLLRAHPSVANFILLDFKTEEACKKVNEYLLDRGVILREMSAYNLPSCLRMTIGSEEENTLVLKLLRDFTSL